jgi:hypothetical protein
VLGRVFFSFSIFSANTLTDKIFYCESVHASWLIFPTL